jgi:hypothetical protein
MSVSCIDLHKTLPCLRDLDRQQYAAARRTRTRIPRQARQVQAQRSSKKEDHWGNGLDQKRRRDKKGVVLVSLFTRRKPKRSYRVRARDVKRSRKKLRTPGRSITAAGREKADPGVGQDDDSGSS